VWAGANGELLEPEYEDEVGVQAEISSSRDPDEWEVMELPKEIEPYVRCGFTCKVGELTCSVPEATGSHIGWLVATGPDLKSAIEKLKERVDLLPDGLTCSVESLAPLLHEVEEAEKQGIELTDKAIPEPEIVL
jgi:hypothetical protein